MSDLVPTNRRRLETADVKAAGLKVAELASVLGVHRTSISDMLAGKTERPTPGAHALVWLWPHLSEDLRASLLKGDHFSGQR